MLTAFDSVKPDLLDGIKHAKTNPIEIANQSFTFVDSNGFAMTDPEFALQPFEGSLEASIAESNFGTVYDHLPDAMSFALYGTHDLWYLLMRLNGASVRGEFRGPVLRFYQPSIASGILLNAMKQVRRRIATVTPIQTQDLTLRPVYG